ncbi:DNA-directed RNA polymerase 2 subunit, putative [Plasmodium ovale curtisi]|uniref:DNA-directed RNA polymerase 2 subunit, putative n=1 Tax=Plasmodium ovale curtisi TaxID=864141 RepID=A0A1A8VMT4_PLAOA|nr:DNA-directed RNA polymerase 2 subunit, putative [Plasmodium ovale curtisi]
MYDMYACSYVIEFTPSFERIINDYQTPLSSLFQDPLLPPIFATSHHRHFPPNTLLNIMAEVTFCEECNNILYARSDRKNKKLIYVCRSCEYISPKQNEEHNIVTRINYNYNRKEDIYIHPETKNDPALGRVRDWTCKQCGNNEAVFLQLPEKISYNPMALIYVCTDKHCHYWEKEIQPPSYEDMFYKSEPSADSFGEHVQKITIKKETGVYNSGDDYQVKKKRLKRISATENEGEEEEKDDDNQSDQNEEEKLKQELNKIISINEKEHNENIDLKEVNESDVDEYFCE